MKPSFIIYGTRGTLPVAGERFSRHGGHTTCFGLKTEKGLIIIDAGTGISLIDDEKDEELLPATLLFTHFHLDHIMALPFWKRLANPRASLKLTTDSSGRKNWRTALTNLFAPPYWPVTLHKLNAHLEFNDLPPAAGLELYGVRVSWCPLFHPQGCLAYRLETGDRSVAIVTDHECGSKKLDDMLLDFCRNVNHLVYDAQYTPDELKARRGWGHSSWEEGADIAGQSGVGELILTHHDYNRPDDAIDEIVAATRRRFPKTKAATDKMIVF